MNAPTPTPRELDEALASIDWQQVALNGGPPCFFVEQGKFCLRAQRWAGHGVHHGYVSLAELFAGAPLRSVRKFRHA